MENNLYKIIVYIKNRGVFIFVVFVDDEDPRNFFMKRATYNTRNLLHLYLQVEYSMRTNNIVHTRTIYMR